MKRLLLSATLAIAAPAAGQAQDLLFDAGALMAGCSASPHDCGVLVQSILARLSVETLSPDDLDTQIGVLAAIVADVAKSAPPSAMEALGATVLKLAAAAGNATTRDGLQLVASMVRQGNAADLPTTAFGRAIPARPNGPGQPATPAIPAGRGRPASRN